MGFAIANVVDPQTGAQSPILGQYFYIIALLFLLSVNGHYLVIDGIYNSFDFIAVDQFISFSEQSFADFVIKTFNKMRSEEHTSELQSRGHLVCRLLLEKKKPIKT